MKKRAAGGIGVIPLSGAYKSTADVGYWLNEQYWGQGIVPKCLMYMINQIIKRFPGQLTRLNGKHFACNSASGRVFQKCGFEFEGILKRMTLDRNGEVQDEVQLGFYF